MRISSESVSFDLPAMQEIRKGFLVAFDVFRQKLLANKKISWYILHIFKHTLQDLMSKMYPGKERKTTRRGKEKVSETAV